MSLSQTNHCVQVGNIPLNSNESEILEMLKGIGKVVSFKIATETHTGKFIGYALCEFIDKDTAFKAIDTLNNKEFHGSFLRVEHARSESNFVKEKSETKSVTFKKIVCPEEKFDENNKDQKTSILVKAPENQIFIEFKDINYVIKKKKKSILQNCSGIVRPGRLLVIIGTSGAGKTSLLNILAGRIRSNRTRDVTGEIKINGQKNYKRTTFQQNTAYVLQEDLVYETLRVRETLMLSANLRLSKSTPTEDKRQIVSKIVSSLELDKVENSLVGGNQIRGLSGGERKRVCIGNELVTNPPFFLLDEPTSGLDSYNAFQLISNLRELARNGRTVVATLHQPSSEMFELFDDLIVVSAGRIIFNGPTDLSVATFEKMGYPLPKHCNPADHFISIANVRNLEDKERIDKLAEEFPSKMAEAIKENDMPEIRSPQQDEVSLEPKKVDRVGFFGQTFYLISQRSLKNYIRTPSTTYVRAAQTLFFSLICGILFFGLGYDSDAIFSRIALLFFILNNLTFNSVLNVVLVFPVEKKIIKNELSNGMYDVLPYYLSKILVEMLINVLVVFIYQLIVYWMIGLANTASQFFIMFLILSTGMQIVYFLGLFIGLIAPSGEIATALTSFFLLPAMLFSGFFINQKDMQPWISWITYLNFFRYLMDMIVYNEFNNDIPRYLFCSPTKQCLYLTGKETIKNLNLSDINFWGWYGISLLFVVFYCSLAFMMLEFKFKTKIGEPLVPNSSSLPLQKETVEV